MVLLFPLRRPVCRPGAMRRSVLAWTVEIDRVATREGYRRLLTGAAGACGCASCRNFERARPRMYPEVFRKLLAAVGVDPRKEIAVRLVSPLEDGLHLYAGAYAFCGEVLSGRPSRGFPFLKEEVDVFERVATGAHVALRPWITDERPWAGCACVRVEFLVVLPWV
ncbi:MAG: hypothetical protein IH608_05885, partial [Proteobacteria bacterium]|nr:hypothetical protein [Pseudomonadota bacterium]